MNTPKNRDWGSIQLKPCPFCGQGIKVYPRKYNPYARCETKECKGTKLPMLNLDDPRDIDAWNQRDKQNPLLWPEELTEPLREVLGLMCFQIAKAAHVFQAAGFSIAKTAEGEQAFMLHRLARHALIHGADWRVNADNDIRAVFNSLKESQ